MKAELGKDFTELSEMESVADDMFYEQRFLDNYAGTIITDPSVAIIELIANAWDAYATDVRIVWPDESTGRQFQIEDNGLGLTLDEFNFIWRAWSYDRIKRSGPSVNPPEGVSGLPRLVFGRNGKGRFASFCFSSEYLVESWREGHSFTCRIKRSATKPFVIEEVETKSTGVEGHGTRITGCGEIAQIGLSEGQTRDLIGSRFLANPAFKVFLHGRQVTFSDIDSRSLSIETLEVEGCGTIKIYHISTQKADRTTKQHGIAWWVQRRAVGECGWRGSDVEKILDGRSSEAKRYTFIVEADFLNEAGAVRQDWSGFIEDSPVWKSAQTEVQKRIRQIIDETNVAAKESKRDNVFGRVSKDVNALPPLSRDRVQSFVNEVVDNCPNFGEQEIVQLTGILTKLEKSKSLYGLLDALHAHESEDFDALTEMLQTWTIGLAKIVLDEIQGRLRLVNELKAKVEKLGIDEVQELQPLFTRGLWMFGPQFESIEFTSNKGMSTVIRELFKDKAGKGSRNRPDFVVLDDGSVGLYARSGYDDEFNESGVEHVVIVDLKTTGLRLGSSEKEQVWKYVKELRSKGYIGEQTRVDGFILGDCIEAGEREPRKEGSSVVITPILYDTMIRRAEKRLLSLYERVQDAPFLSEQREELKHFLDPLEAIQEDMIGTQSL